MRASRATLFFVAVVALVLECLLSLVVGGGPGWQATSSLSVTDHPQVPCPADGVAREHVPPSFMDRNGRVGPPPSPSHDRMFSHQDPDRAPVLHDSPNLAGFAIDPTAAELLRASMLPVTWEGTSGWMHCAPPTEHEHPSRGSLRQPYPPWTAGRRGALI